MKYHLLNGVERDIQPRTSISSVFIALVVGWALSLVFIDLVAPHTHSQALNIVPKQHATISRPLSVESSIPTQAGIISDTTAPLSTWADEDSLQYGDSTQNTDTTPLQSDDVGNILQPALVAIQSNMELYN